MQKIKEPIERNSIKKEQNYQDKSGIRRGNPS
jgi:hypothetical protein